MSKPSESQIAQRYLTHEPARVEIYGKKEALLCRMSNLSATGAFFEILSSSYLPQVGDLICVTINLKDINRIHVFNGEVIWRKDHGMGVSFVKQKELIRKLAG